MEYSDLSVEYIWPWEKLSKIRLIDNLVLITNQLEKHNLDAYSARKTQKTLLNVTLLQIFNLKQLYLNKKWSKSHDLSDL